MTPYRPAGGIDSARITPEIPHDRPERGIPHPNPRHTPGRLPPRRSPGPAWHGADIASRAPLPGPARLGTARPIPVSYVGHAPYDSLPRNIHCLLRTACLPSQFRALHVHDTPTRHKGSPQFPSLPDREGARAHRHRRRRPSLGPAKRRRHPDACSRMSTGRPHGRLNVGATAKRLVECPRQVGFRRSVPIYFHWGTT